MKKLFYVLLAAVLVMGLTACSGGSVDFVSEDDTDSADFIGTLMINTDGMGSIAYGLEDEDVEFDEEYPSQSAMVNLTEPETYVIKAKADDGWKFVKWTKDGADFSEEPEITVDVDGDIEFRAVFEAE